MARMNFNATRLCFLLVEHTEAGYHDCFGPWDTPQEAHEEQLQPMMPYLHPGDRWFILTPIEVGEVRSSNGVRGDDG